MLRNALCALALVGLSAVPTSSQAYPRYYPYYRPYYPIAGPSFGLSFYSGPRYYGRAVLPVGHPPITYGSIHYRPRYPQSPPPATTPQTSSMQPAPQTSSEESRVVGYMQLQGGVFDPQGNVTNAATGSVRLGASIDKRLQLGVQVDWNHRNADETAIVSRDTLPGGDPVTRERQLSSVQADVVPTMAFLQIAPLGVKFGPYIGAAGGYHMMFLTAQLQNGQDFDATYQGWGWQAYAGLAIPLSRYMRLTGEVFTNEAKLDRDVDDGVGGTYKEVVDTGGSGARGGLSFSF